MKTLYRYRDAISGFFELPTRNARRLLPRGMEPIEVQHGTSVLAVAVFDFDASEVGAYCEVVYAVLVPPLVQGGQLPNGAFFPWRIGVTTGAAREHAIKRWHLPHWMENVDVQLVRADDSLTATMTAGGAPALALTITAHTWRPAAHRYQSFQRDDSGSYLASFVTDGEQSEHQEEAGRVVLHDSAFNEGLAISDVPETPLREIWGRRGCQLFNPLLRLW
jgi:hypothetical protein